MQRDRGSNRTETRELVKKIRDTKGTLHAKMGSVKDRNGTDLKEAEDIKRWQEYKKDLHNSDNYNGVITHLEPDILESKVKWVSESITTNRECQLVQPLWRTVWRFLKKLEMELPYAPAIPLLGIYTERDTSNPISLQHCLQ